MFTPYFTFLNSQNFHLAFTALYYASFVLVPLGLILLLFELWLTYKRETWVAAEPVVLLEIKVPRDVFKSPKSMEFLMNGLFKKGDKEANWWELYVQGHTRPVSSLEIVSIDGQIHFYVRVVKWLKEIVESQLYSQYPGVEIFEVPDYTLPVTYDKEKIGLVGTEFLLTKPDVYPIKTYIDYGMDKDPKEEYKIDPLTPFIEHIGSFGRGHQFWLQIVIRAHQPKEPYFYTDPDTKQRVRLEWVKTAQKEIDRILKKSKGEIDKETGKTIPGTTRFATTAEMEVIEALERSISKNAFDTGVRLIYTAPKDIFKTSNISGAVGSVMHFSSQNLNGFRTSNWTGGKYTFPWQDRKKKKTTLEKKEMLDAYKHRQFFYRPYKKKFFVLNVEELATVFHFPGQVSTTPTYSRIESKKAEAPANLPI